MFEPAFDLTKQGKVTLLQKFLEVSTLQKMYYDFQVEYAKHVLYLQENLKKRDERLKEFDQYDDKIKEIVLTVVSGKKDRTEIKKELTDEESSQYEEAFNLYYAAENLNNEAGIAKATAKEHEAVIKDIKKAIDDKSNEL